MGATVTKPGKLPKAVSNLGWLLRNWKTVKRFDWKHSASGFNQETTGPIAGILQATLDDGTLYQTTFADWGVLLSFLARPVFLGLPLHITAPDGCTLTNPVTIGDMPYDVMRLNRLKYPETD